MLCDMSHAEKSDLSQCGFSLTVTFKLKRRMRLLQIKRVKRPVERIVKGHYDNHQALKQDNKLYQGCMLMLV